MMLHFERSLKTPQLYPQNIQRSFAQQSNECKRFPEETEILCHKEQDANWFSLDVLKLMKKKLMTSFEIKLICWSRGSNFQINIILKAVPENTNPIVNIDPIPIKAFKRVGSS